MIPNNIVPSLKIALEIKPPNISAYVFGGLKRPPNFVKSDRIGKFNLEKVDGGVAVGDIGFRNCQLHVTTIPFVANFKV